MCYRTEFDINVLFIHLRTRKCLLMPLFLLCPIRFTLINCNISNHNGRLYFLSHFLSGGLYQFQGTILLQRAILFSQHAGKQQNWRSSELVLLRKDGNRLHGILSAQYNNLRLVFNRNAVGVGVGVVSRVISASESESKECSFSTYESVANVPQRNKKPILMHFPTLSDWFSFSASASDSDNLVFTRLYAKRERRSRKRNRTAFFTRS